MTKKEIPGWGLFTDDGKLIEAYPRYEVAMEMAKIAYEYKHPRTVKPLTLIIEE